MNRPFAMVNPAILYDEAFQKLSPNSQLSFMVMLTHENIQLTGAGTMSPQILADCLGWKKEDCEDWFVELQESGLISYDPDYRVVLIGNWWSHTTLTERGLETILLSLKHGDYGRSMGSNEFLALTALLEELENPISQKSKRIKRVLKSEAKSLVQERLSKLERPKLRAVEQQSVNENGPEFNGYDNQPSEILEA